MIIKKTKNNRFLKDLIDIKFPFINCYSQNIELELVLLENSQKKVIRVINLLVISQAFNQMFNFLRFFKENSKFLVIFLVEDRFIASLMSNILLSLNCSKIKIFRNHHQLSQFRKTTIKDFFFILFCYESFRGSEKKIFKKFCDKSIFLIFELDTMLNLKELRSFGSYRILGNLNTLDKIVFVLTAIVVNIQNKKEFLRV